MKPVIGVSACLYGWAVRYDGKDKFLELNPDERKRFSWVPLCPEVAAGLGVPRAPIHWVVRSQEERLVQGENDVQEQLQMAVQKLLLGRFDGFLLKSKSPSCSPHPLPLVGDCSATGPGLLVREILKFNRGCPIIDEVAWQDPSLKAQFLRRVLARVNAKDGPHA